MLSLEAGMESLRGNQTHRYAVCWDIERSDATHFRFTTHDHDLILADGFTYSPAGGLNQTAARKESGLREQNQEFSGVITSDKITVDDLRGGKFREAEVTQSLIDFRYPWAGSLQTLKYNIAQTTFDGELWEAEVTGITRRLKQSIGDVVGRTCKADVGDSDCKVNLDHVDYRALGTIAIEISEERRIFKTSGVGTGWGDDFFNHGKLVWTSGNNDDIISMVKDWVSADVQCELILPTPFDIQIGDTFTIYAGCEKTKSVCSSKFSNLVNFRGDPYIPGTDKLLQTPTY